MSRQRRHTNKSIVIHELLEPRRLLVSDVPTDFDDDGQTGLSDLERLAAEVQAGTNNPQLDLTGDALVNHLDVDRFLDIAGTRRGDTNLDGQIEFSDFLVLSGNFGNPGAWSQGDFDQNGQVEFSDFLALSAAFNKPGVYVGDIQVLIDDGATLPSNASTDQSLVGIEGQTNPYATVVMAGIPTRADNDGRFRVLGVPLSLGSNTLAIQVETVIGAEITSTIDINRNPREGAIVLNEKGAFATQHTELLELGTGDSGRAVRFDIETTFEKEADNEDTLLVYLVEADDPNLTLLDRGENGTSLFSMAGEDVELLPGTVTFDGQRVEVDVSEIAANRALIVFQLLSLDRDEMSLVSIENLQTVGRVQTSPAPTLPALYDGVARGGPVDFQGLAPSSDLQFLFENRRFDPSSNTYTFDMRIRNLGTSTLARTVIAFEDLPDDIVLRDVSGQDSLGRPYINFTTTHPVGGLAPGNVSEAISISLENPGDRPLSLNPTAVVGVNRRPVFPEIAPISLVPGDYREVALGANDPNGDLVTYRLATDLRNIPNGMLKGNGVFVFEPEPGQEGEYRIDVVATDGNAEVMQTLVVTVEDDPLSTTRLVGTLRNNRNEPLEGVRLSVGDLETMTDSLGNFTFEAASFDSEFITFHADELAGNDRYPFMKKRLSFFLDRDPYSGALNTIARTVHLPALDIANAVQLEQESETVATNPNFPGTKLVIPMGSAVDQDGQAVNGRIGVMEVPKDRLPRKLPDHLSPDAVYAVYTTGTKDVTFKIPAQFTAPNKAGFAPGTVLNLWEVNPVSEKFEIVGRGRVSADGALIEALEGGVVVGLGGENNANWRLFTPTSPGAGSGSPSPPCLLSCKASPPGPEISDWLLESGAVIERHELATYQSLGEQRGVNLVYESTAADPRPIIRWSFNDVPAWVTRSTKPTFVFANLMINRGSFEFELPGIPGSLGNEHLWRAPKSGGDVEIALQADLSSQPTGLYKYLVRSGYRGGLATGASLSIPGQLIHINRTSSVFGAGWGVEGVQEILESPDGSALLIDHGGDAVPFLAPELGERVYPSVAGDFSTLQKAEDGRFQRVMKDRTLYQFDSQNRLEFVRDRNGNRTTYFYNDLGIDRIVDPAGLITRFIYVDGKVSSIIDPANRTTQQTYDADGNLQRIQDPDGTSRTFGYDDRHHLTSEVDKRGFLEETFYGFHGRVERGVRKDGSEIRLAAYQTQGLFPPRQTMNQEDPPTAITREAANAEYSDGNGNTTYYQIDAFGQIVTSNDALGNKPTNDHDDNNLVTTQTDARGNETLYTYDERGNVLSITDAFTPIPGQNDPARADQQGDGEASDSQGGVIAAAHDGSDDVRWTADADGEWNNPANWSTGSVPGAEDHVVIDRPGVNITISHSVGETIVHSLELHESLQVSGGRLIVEERLVIQSGQGLHVTNPETAFVSRGSAAIDGAIIRSTGGATIDIPSAETFLGGVLEIDGNGTVSAPNLVFVDNSAFRLSGGATFKLNAKSWKGSRADVIFSAEGPGTSLDLSSLQTFDVTADFNRVRVSTISATNSGQIDLSNLQTIHGRTGSDRLDIVTNSGGNIDLTAVVTTENNVLFVDEEPAMGQVARAHGTESSDPVRWISATSGDWEDPSRWSTGEVPGSDDNVIIDVPDQTVTVTISSTVSAHALNAVEHITIAGGTLRVLDDSSVNNLSIDASGTLEAVGPGVDVTIQGQSSLDGVNITSIGGAAVSIPDATSFTNGTISIQGPGTVQVPNVSNIDNTAFRLSGGATLDVAATSWKGTRADVIFSAEGAGTNLNLSALTSFDVTADFNGVRVSTISASASGLVDLSNLQTIKGRTGSDRLDVRMSK